ncbi:hypothetical protein DL96DRAFT_1606596 [Flagelloscypha sp. PMI_526]|nr:hypothetical protein DL96DRAFT_1606596 [Flagelloscypha sp. PMI_526]
MPLNAFELPSELEREICERCPEPTRKALVKVAHRFHAWNTPSLYKTINLDGGNDSDRAALLGATLKSQPDLANYVESIQLILPFKDAELCSTILSSCVRLSTLTLHVRSGLFPSSEYISAICGLPLTSLTVIENPWQQLTCFAHMLLSTATSSNARCLSTLQHISIPNLLPVMHLLETTQNSIKTVETYVFGRPRFPWAGYFSFHMQENQQLEKLTLVGAWEDPSYAQLDEEMKRRIVMVPYVDEWCLLSVLG